MAARVLLITGGDPAGHPFHETAPATKQVLSSGPFDLVEDTNLDRVKQAGGLEEFDAVVLHGRFPGRDDAAERALEGFVHAGKGLVVVHIASSSFEFAPRWRRLVGRVWEYGYPGPPFTSGHPEPPGPFRVNVVDTAHPAVAGVRDFDLARDERYQALLTAPDAQIHDLATATLEGRTEPVVWVLTPPQGGRVFHTALGHERSTYENPAFQTLLKTGVAWAAG